MSIYTDTSIYTCSALRQEGAMNAAAHVFPRQVGFYVAWESHDETFEMFERND